MERYSCRILSEPNILEIIKSVCSLQKPLVFGYRLHLCYFTGLLYSVTEAEHLLEKTREEAIPSFLLAFTKDFCWIYSHWKVAACHFPGSQVQGGTKWFLATGKESALSFPRTCASVLHFAKWIESENSRRG